MGTLRPLALPEDCLAFLFFVSPVERKTMKAMTFDKSFAEKKDTFANLIANLSRMVLTTSERLLYIKLLTRGFRSTPICVCNMRIRCCGSGFLPRIWPGAPSTSNFEAACWSKLATLKEQEHCK